MSRIHNAARLLHTLGVSTPEDIDVEAIADYCGCTVRFRCLDGCAARIIGVGDRAIISIDEASPQGRRRFSIAHELGHWMEDRGKLSFECQRSDLRQPWQRKTNPEARANEFAAELLLPQFLAQPAIRAKPVTFKTVDILMDQFRVSRTAAAIRLVQLSEMPSMLVCHGRQGRKWFAANRPVDGNLWPLERPSPDTDAYELLRGGTGGDRAQTVDADDWINHPLAKNYTIQEHSVRSGDDVLTLLWWKDPSMVDDLIH